VQLAEPFEARATACPVAYSEWSSARDGGRRGRGFGKFSLSERGTEDLEQDAVPSFLPPPRQHERMDLEHLGNGLHLDAFQLAESHRLELELQTVSTDFRGTSSGRRTPPLGGSIYFIEGRSTVRLNEVLGRSSQP